MSEMKTSGVLHPRKDVLSVDSVDEILKASKSVKDNGGNGLDKRLGGISQRL